MSTDPGSHVVVGALLRREGRCLLVHRVPTRDWHPDCWDLPGGHVDPGEEPAAAMARELREELGVTAEVTGEPFAHVQGVDFLMDVFLVVSWVGEPTNRAPDEHDALAWLTPRELAGKRFIDPGLPALVEAALR